MVGDRRGYGRDESGLGEGVSLGSWGAGLRLCLAPESVGSTFRCQVDLEDPERDIGGQALPHCQKQGLQEIQKVRVAGSVCGCE